MITQENIPYIADEIKAMVKTCEKYNKALEKAKEFYVICKKCGAKDTVNFLENTFPELIEKEFLLQQLCQNRESEKSSLGWKSKVRINPDENKPKFKVSDWIITPKNIVLQITNIKGTRYAFNNSSHYWEIYYCDKECRLWTIQDAQDGDVLMTTKTRNCPFIYRKTEYNKHLAHYYAGVDGNGDFCEGCLKRRLYHFGSVTNITPATKEQRDLLFRKMKEAGYVWDAENKILKKIEPKKLDADKVIEWLCNNSTLFGAKWCKTENIIEQFKKDFGYDK